MRILLITFEFLPQPGGIGTYAYQIATHLQRLDNQVTVLAHSLGCSKTECQEFDAGCPLEVIRFPEPGNKINRIRSRFRTAWKVARAGNYDLLFVVHPNAAIIAYAYRHRFGTPYVLMGHGSEFLYDSAIWRQVIRKTFNAANHVLTNSHYTTSLAKRAGIVNQHLTTLPLGADSQCFDPARYDGQDLKKRVGDQQRRIVLTVGRLSRRKGHSFVIEAIDMLRDEFPDLLYLIVGDGPERANLEQQIGERKLDRHVVLTGRVDAERLPEYYTMCDLFVLNSTLDESEQAEGFGIVLIEAGLMGKPVIGVRGSGMEDAVEDGKSGLLVPMNDVAATAEAIKTYLANPQLRHKHGNYGRTRALRQFTWEKVAQQTNKILQQAAERGRR